MIKECMLTLLLLVASIGVFSQSLFQKIYKGNYEYISASTVLELRDKGFLIIGWIDPPGPTHRKCLITKTDNYGRVIWSRTYGSRETNYALAGTETDDGYIIVGNAGTEMDLEGNVERDTYIFKINKSGDLIWSKSGQNGHGTISKIHPIAGGCLLAGYTNIHGDGDMHFIKIDGSGNVLWELTLGGALPDYITQLVFLQDGSFIVGGITDHFETAKRNIFLLRIDSNGSTVWSKSLDKNYDNLSSIALVSQEEFIISGYISNFDNGSNTPQVFISKLSTAGDLKWAKTYNIDSYEKNFVTTGPTKAIYLAARYSLEPQASSNLLLTQLDQQGNVLSPSILFRSFQTDYAIYTKFTTDGNLLTLAGSYLGREKGSALYLNKIHPSLDRACETEAVEITSKDIILQEADPSFILNTIETTLKAAPTTISKAYLSEDAVCISLDHVTIDDIVKIYPNPATDQLYLELVKGAYEHIQISMVSVTGKQVLSLDVPYLDNNKHTINISGFTSGVYYVQIRTNVGVLFKKLIVL